MHSRYHLSKPRRPKRRKGGEGNVFLADKVVPPPETFEIPKTDVDFPASKVREKDARREK